MKTKGGFCVRSRRRSGQTWVMMALVVATLASSLQVGIGPSSAQTPSSPSTTPPGAPSSFPPAIDTAAKAGKEPPAAEVPTPDRSLAGQPPRLAQGKPGEELVDRRTASSKTFVSDQPGQLRTELNDGPVHFLDGQGRWADIDETLVVGKDGRRHAAANAFDLSVAPSSTDTAVARLAVDDKHSVGFSLDGAAKVTAKADARSVTYPKVRNDTDVRLRSRNNGVKEELVLASPGAPDRFVFPLELKGLTASINEAGDVIYRDEPGVERARTPHGFMTDSNVDPRSGEAPISLGVTYALIPWGKGTALEVRLDRAWLDHPSRVYPVIVDPEIHNAAWGDDTYVMSGFSRDNSWDAELKVGTYDGGAHIGRSYMHFDTRALAGASVQRAELHAAERHSWNCSYWPEPAYRVTQGWDGRTMRDFPGAAVDPNWVGGTWDGTTCGARTAKWDVTGMAAYWASVGEGQGSISLRATNESENNMYKKYASTEAGAPPALHVWYTPPNRPPAVPYGITPAHGTILGMPTTSVSAIYADPDGTPGYLAFGVWNYQNQLVWSQWSGLTCSGCRVTFNLPALPDNWYFVMVTAHDGVQYSGGSTTTPAWSSPQWFFIDTLAPAVADVTPGASAVVPGPTQVSARYSEPYGFAGYVYFWVVKPDGTVAKEGWSSQVCSGCTASIALPPLAVNWYTLYAMAYDGRQTGPISGGHKFLVSVGWDVEDMVDVDRLASSLQSTFGARLGSWWLEGGEGLEVSGDNMMMVGLVGTDSSDSSRLHQALMAADPGYGDWSVESRFGMVSQTYSNERLAGFQQSIVDIVNSSDGAALGTAHVGILPGAGRVRLLTDAHSAAVESRIAQTVPGDAYEIQVVSGLTFDPMDDRFSSPLRAGKGIILEQPGTNRGRCTSGFLFQRAGELVGTTAGHCAITGDSVGVGQATVVSNVGTVGFNPFRQDPLGIDAAWYSFAPGVAPEAAVHVRDTQILPVRRSRSNANIVAGSTRVCVVGRVTTTRTCGTVSTNGRAFTRYKYTDVRTGELIPKTLVRMACARGWTNGIPRGGDSGSPVFRYIGVDGGKDNASEAVGILAGGFGGTDEVCFSTVQDVSSAYAMTLALG